MERRKYMPAYEDAKGAKPGGNRMYTVRFAPGAFPTVNAFWSLTMYGTDYNLVDNPINRYSLGDCSPLKRDADGGITIHVQSESPGPALEANWLPAPKATFYMVLRNYLPQKPLLDRTWVPPSVVRVS